MSDIVFYSNPQSRGRIISWMLEELGEPYDTEWIRYGEQMKGPQYLAINPMGKVPAISHNGAVVTECPAICCYLAACYPQKALIPAPGDPALAAFYRWMFFAAGPIEQAITVKAMGWELPEGRSGTVGYGNFDDVLDAMELALGKGPYVCGDQFTAVDVYFGSHVNFGMAFGSLEKRDAFTAYSERLVTRPAFIRAQEINDEAAPEFSTYVESR